MNRTQTLTQSTAEESLAKQVETLTRLVADQKRELDEVRKKYTELLEKYIRLERGFRPPTSERKDVVNEQLSLAILGLSLAPNAADPPVEEAQEPSPPPDDSPEPAPETPPARPRPTGRKPIPPSIPRVVITCLPPEVEQEGTNAFIRIGEEVSETLEHCRGSLVVIRTVRPKFIRKGDTISPASELAQQESQPGSAEPAEALQTRVLIAPPPELPIPKGLAGPGLLADTLVKRWWDHLPLHRQEGIWSREGWDVSRSTLSSFHDALSELVAPLLDAMWNHARGQPWLLTDATVVKVQAKLKCNTGYFFVVIAPELHVLYWFTPKHTKAVIRTILGHFRGHLVADAHAIYDHLYALGQCTEVGCWAHVRRYFFKSVPTDPEQAKFGIEQIGKLFFVERQIAKLSPEQKKRARQERSKPTVDAFFEWCKQQKEQQLEHSPIHAAVTYALNQETALRRFLDDGRLPLHNNDSERALRRQAVGRKNWLFVGSDDGGQANARFTSLMASCQLHQIESRAYLRDLFCLLPNWPKKDVLQLAPAFWKETSAKPEVVAMLEKNPFRRIAETYAAGPEPVSQKKETGDGTVNHVVC